MAQITDTAAPVVWEFQRYRGPGEGQDKWLDNQSALARILSAVQADIRSAIPYATTVLPRVRLLTWKEACDRSWDMSLVWDARAHAVEGTLVDPANINAYAASGHNFVLPLPRTPTLDASPHIVVATFPMPVTPELCHQLALDAAATTRPMAHYSVAAQSLCNGCALVQHWKPGAVPLKARAGERPLDARQVAAATGALIATGALTY